VGAGFPLEKDTVCVNLARGGDMMESTDCSDLGERSLISFSFLSPCTQLLVLLMVLVPALVLLEIKLELKLELQIISNENQYSKAGSTMLANKVNKHDLSIGGHFSQNMPTSPTFLLHLISQYCT
jgi:hypothetical protein